MSSHVLQGVTVPLVTPMTSDGVPDPEALLTVVDHVVRAGVDNLFVLGGNGEHPGVLYEEVAPIVRAVSRHLDALGVRGRVSLLCGCGGASTREALRRGGAAAEAGADGLVALPPYYFRHPDDELVDHFRAIAGIGAPLIAYNIPAYTNNPLTVDVVRVLRDDVGIVGIKDSSADDAYFRQLLALAAERPAFGVSQGAERRLLWALRQGAVGITPGLANVAPQWCVELLREYRSPEAEAIQAQLDALGGIHRVRTGIAGTKGALSLLGICRGSPSPPFRTLSDDELLEVRRILQGVGLLA